MLPARKTTDLLEKHIQNTCTQFLELDGWRTIVTDPAHLRGMGVTEPGMADRLYIRYQDYEVDNALNGPEGDFLLSICSVLWIEWKRLARGKPTKTSQAQHLWHARERARGALTWKAGEDFPATIEGFQEYYRKSGLARRV